MDALFWLPIENTTRDYILDSIVALSNFNNLAVNMTAAVTIKEAHIRLPQKMREIITLKANCI